jgi:hypothetical protein
VISVTSVAHPCFISVSSVAQRSVFVAFATFCGLSVWLDGRLASPSLCPRWLVSLTRCLRDLCDLRGWSIWLAWRLAAPSVFPSVAPEFIPSLHNASRKWRRLSLWAVRPQKLVLPGDSWAYEGLLSPNEEGGRTGNPHSGIWRGTASEEIRALFPRTYSCYHLLRRTPPGGSKFSLTLRDGSTMFGNRKSGPFGIIGIGYTDRCWISR